MQGWQTPYLGLRDLPRELTEFELQAFFSFSRSLVVSVRTGPRDAAPSRTSSVPTQLLRLTLAWSWAMWRAIKPVAQTQQNVQFRRAMFNGDRNGDQPTRESKKVSRR